MARPIVITLTVTVEAEVPNTWARDEETLWANVQELLAVTAEPLKASEGADAEEKKLAAKAQKLVVGDVTVEFSEIEVEE